MCGRASFLFAQQNKSDRFRVASKIEYSMCRFAKRNRHSSVFYFVVFLKLRPKSGNANFILVSRWFISFVLSLRSAHRVLEVAKATTQSCTKAQTDILLQHVPTATRKRPHNKALHPTAYSSVRSSLRFRRRVSLVVVPLRPALQHN